jgi:hypothetical protein
MNMIKKSLHAILIPVLIFSMLSCFDDSDDECTPQPWDCEETPYTKGTVTINLTIDDDITSLDVVVRRGEYFETGTLYATYNNQTTSTITITNAPVDYYSAQTVYNYRGKTITVTDGDEIENDSESYCEGSCYELDNAEIALEFDKEAFDKLLKGGGDDCFIATAAYGSKDDYRVKAFRNFRDTVLMGNSAGRYLVSLYYKLSPPAAEVIKHNEPLRTAASIMLYPLYIAVTFPIAAVAVLILSAAGTAGMIGSRRRKNNRMEKNT